MTKEIHGKVTDVRKSLPRVATVQCRLCCCFDTGQWADTSPARALTPVQCHIAATLQPFTHCGSQHFEDEHSFRLLRQTGESCGMKRFRCSKLTCQADSPESHFGGKLAREQQRDLQHQREGFARANLLELIFVQSSCEAQTQMCLLWQWNRFARSGALSCSGRL
jgi:hypothetical protein